MSRSSFFLFLFIAAAALEIVALLTGWEGGNVVAKPLIVPALIGYYLARRPSPSFIFVMALFFCWAGDVFLLFQSGNELFFIFGLVAFLLGHVLYIICYRSFQLPSNADELLMTQKVRFSLPIVLAGTGLIVILFPTLGPLKIPVVVYATVLMWMVMTALFRYGRTNSASFWLIFGGAILFMVSDSLLAINKFYSPFSSSGPLVMATYIAAQYFIVAGTVRHGD